MIAVHPGELGVADHLADLEDELKRAVEAWELLSFLAEIPREPLGFAVANDFLVPVLHHLISSTPLEPRGAL